MLTFIYIDQIEIQKGGWICNDEASSFLFSKWSGWKETYLSSYEIIQSNQWMIKSFSIVFLKDNSPVITVIFIIN